MSKKKLVQWFSVLLICSGGVLALLGYLRLAGIGFFGIGVAVYLLYREQLLLVQEAKKTSYELRQGVSGMRGTNRWYGKQLLDLANSTYTRVRDFHDAAIKGDGIRRVSNEDVSCSQTALPSELTDFVRAGRLSTPHVVNPNATENLTKVLDPNYKHRVAGVFSESLFQEVNVEISRWRPGTVFATLRASRPDLVLLDERYLDDGQWNGTFTASGTNLIKEILRGISWCNHYDIPVYLIKDATIPDAHSGVIRRAQVVDLPLSTESQAETFGAPMTPVLTRANAVASTRQAET